MKLPKLPLALFCSSAILAAADISVLDHGAKPNDDTDDGTAIRAAFQAARAAADPVVIFPPGVYRVGQPEGEEAKALVEVYKYPRITIRGEGAEVVGTGTRALFRFEQCGEVSVSGLTVDWSPLPYTGGKVVASGTDSVDVAVPDAYPLLEEPVQLITAVNAQTKVALRPGQKDYFQISQKLSRLKAKVVAPGVLRLFRDPGADRVSSTQKGQAMPEVGTYLMAFYHVRGGGAFPARDCGRVHYSNLQVYSVPGMGFAVRTTNSAKVENCRVTIRPDSGRWVSSTVDASHFNMVREKVELIGCVFEDMGDDGSNVHGMYTMVHERPEKNVVVLRGWGNPFSIPGSQHDLGEPNGQMRVGDILEFSGTAGRHVPACEGRIAEVAEVKVDDLTLKRVRLEAELPAFVGPGTVVANADEVADLLMKDCMVRRNRGQGIRVKTRNAIIEDCLFENIHGNGIWIFCDADYGRESIASRNVIIRDNVFRGNARAVKVSVGRQEPIDREAHENLVIEGNTIERCGSEPIQLQSVKGAFIRKNTIRTSGTAPIFFDETSSGIQIGENTFTEP